MMAEGRPKPDFGGAAMQASQWVHSFLRRVLNPATKTLNRSASMAGIALLCASVQSIIPTLAHGQTEPPRVRQARRFLAQRGNPRAGAWQMRHQGDAHSMAIPADASDMPVWQPV